MKQKNNSLGVELLNNYQNSEIKTLVNQIKPFMTLTESDVMGGHIRYCVSTQNGQMICAGVIENPLVSIKMTDDNKHLVTVSDRQEENCFTFYLNSISIQKEYLLFDYGIMFESNGIKYHLEIVSNAALDLVDESEQAENTESLCEEELDEEELDDLIGWVCPECGISCLSATKHINLVCGDCGVPMEMLK